jgi:hypothetical protein
MRDLHSEAGLAKTDDGQYIGTKAQWDELERLQEEYAQEIENQNYKYGEPKTEP